MLLATIIIAVIVTVIIVNLRDLKEWKRYLQQKQDNERIMMDVGVSPLFDEKGLD